MVKEWYLLSSPYSQLSGFETEAFDDYAEEGFEEALDSAVGTDVQLCNYDLSVCKDIRAIVQNNVQDTKLKALNRMFLTRIGTVKAGMYIKYKNRYWLIIGLVDDNGMYEKSLGIHCNYYLSWINKQHKLVQRWVNVASASQYNHGETSTQYLTVRSDQMLVLSPDDDECVLLDESNRFVVDRRIKIYERDIDPETESDTSYPLIVYRFTRNDAVYSDYQDSGHHEFMIVQDEQHEGDGYYKFGDKSAWVCEFDAEKKPVAEEPPKGRSVILADSYEIYNGIESDVFTAVFYDEDRNEVVDVVPRWSIVPAKDATYSLDDLRSAVEMQYADKSVLFFVDDTSLINKKFLLSLDADGYETTSVEITIRPFI